MQKPVKRVKKAEFVVGIDEAGRGPLAGPVAVGSVLAGAAELSRLRRVFKSIKGKDSKKLTEAEREEWFAVIKAEADAGNLTWRVSLSGSAMIDKKGIVPAIRSALSRSLVAVADDSSRTRVLLDGGLKAPAEFSNQKTIIKGDEKELLISLASICAKVTRDRYMCRLAKKYPEYGFEVHKGYGTKRHAEGIKSFGLCALHRKSFIRKNFNFLK
ncbi:MAG TPA: ribonuclease HII [Candidatus Paceibacterota bacterium]|jgi:ribonuclease HII|nr:ribonuclease HII [Candidatus Paceibacterota bacterium]